MKSGWSLLFFFTQEVLTHILRFVRALVSGVPGAAQSFDDSTLDAIERGRHCLSRSSTQTKPLCSSLKVIFLVTNGFHYYYPAWGIYFAIELELSDCWKVLAR